MASSVLVWDIIFLVWLVGAMAGVFHGLVMAVIGKYEVDDVLWNFLRSLLWPANLVLWTLDRIPPLGKDDRIPYITESLHEDAHVWMDYEDVVVPRRSLGTSYIFSTLSMMEFLDAAPEGDLYVNSSTKDMYVRYMDNWHYLRTLTDEEMELQWMM